jgi:uncharacterized repeat protein (TIGR03803 family)
MMCSRKFSLRLALAVAGLFVSLFVTTSPAQNLLYSFDGQHGASPRGLLVFDSAGNLFGTTFGGGSTNKGVVFELSPSGGGNWTETVRHNFGVGADGATSYSGLVIDSAGNLYGTTTAGGTFGMGTVFKVSPSIGPNWPETVIWNFGGTGDGATPYDTLIFDSAGNLYGTTFAGGANGAGTVFKLTPDGSGGWNETILYSFIGGTDGSAPYAGIIFDSNGDIFGTTTAAGTFGGGTAFELIPTGSGLRHKILHQFGGFGDGANPYGGLVLDGAGNLFGTTVNGGGYNNAVRFGAGTAFELSPNGPVAWVEALIHLFCDSSSCTDVNPYDALIMDSSGNLFGTTEGGQHKLGTIFQLSPESSGPWPETVLGGFAYNPPDPNRPFSGLIFDSAGNLYGMSSAGGTLNFGTIYEVVR